MLIRIVSMIINEKRFSVEHVEMSIYVSQNLQIYKCEN